MRNSTVSETELLASVLKQLRERLPSNWAVQKKAGSGQGRFGSNGVRPDRVFEIEDPEGRRARVLVGVKRALEPRAVAPLADQLRQYAADGWLVVAPFLGPRARELLRSRGCGFADETGNLWLSISRPGLFINTSGADKSPTRLERPIQSLRGRAAGRAVRALCDYAPPLRVRDLASRTGVSAPTLSRVIAFLEKEALLERDERGTVTTLDWEGTIRRWAEDYSFSKSNTVRTFIDPRGIGGLREKLAKMAPRYAATGSLAATVVDPAATVAPVRLAQIYVQEIAEAARSLDLAKAEAGANVMLVEPFDPVVFERTRECGGIICAALTQVAADLLGSPGRGPQEADALLEWMRANVDAWRS